MADKRKRRRQDENADPPTKEEYAVAKYLRFNCPIREGKLVGMTVQCFISSKAVDALLESKWGAGKSNSDLLFSNRHSCVSFCDKLLQKGLFHRAARAEKKKSEKSKKKKKLKEGEEVEPAEEEKEKKGKKEKKSKKEKDEGEKEEEVDKKSSEKDEKKEEDKDKKKKEKKLKLVMHEDQVFKDGDEVFVWIYDPVPVKTFIIGLLLVLGAIGLCLFPLWPSEVRVGVYYLSLSGAVFVGLILVLIVVRFILFCLIWGLTIGKHHFWFLPNLTEDVGFFDSFRPLYKHDFFDGSKKEKEKPRSKKSKDSDESEKDAKGRGEGKTESKSKVGKDSDEDKEEQNGFELVEKEDVDQFEVDGENVVEDDENVVDDDDENEFDDENCVDDENNFDDESPENDDEDNEENPADNSDENEPKKTK